MGDSLPAIVAPIIAVAGAVFTAGAAVVSVGVAAAGAVGIGAGTLFSLAATTALLGVEYLLRPSAGGQPQLAPPQSGPPPVPARKTVRQSDTPRSFIFGRTRTAGAYFLYETDGYFGSVSGSAKTLFQGIYICDGPIDGFDAFICDDEAPPIARSNAGLGISDGTEDANTYVFTGGLKYGPVFQSGSNSLSGYFAVAFAPINATETGQYSQLIADNDGFNTSLVTAMWPTTCVGKGITAVYTWASTIFLSSQRPSRFPLGFPEWAFCVRGARIYDPRDTTQTETENGVWTLYNSTWKWSENPALIAAHFMSWLINENLTAVTGVDWDSIAAAADDCDALSPATMRNIAGGAPGAASERFARMTGVYYFTTPPREFLSRIMAACDGTYTIDQYGRFTMWIGKWEDPGVTFYERDVSSFVEEFVAPVTESVNEIHSTYAEPQNAYQRFEAQTWFDNDSIAKVGRRVVSINYDLVPSPNQAYRLSQRYARRINGKRKLQITLGPRGMLAFKQRVVGLNLPQFGIAQSTWRVEALQPEGNLTCWTATLRELTPDVFADDAAPRDPASTLRVAAALVSAAPTNAIAAKYDGSAPGAGYAVISMNLHLNDPSSSTPGIDYANMIQEQTVVYEVAYSTDGGSNYTTATIYLSNYIVRTPDLPKGTTVTYKIRYMNSDGSYTAYSGTGAITL